MRLTKPFEDLPELSVAVPELKDLQVPYKSWKYIQLSEDVLLLTVDDEEFLSCYTYLNDAFWSSIKGLGKVYFGQIGDGVRKVKTCLVRCGRGSTQASGAQNVARTAIEILKPKVVFGVGCCGGLKKEKTKVGDVVISANLTTYAEKKSINDRPQWRGNILNVSKNIGGLIRYAADGWKPPMKDPKSREVKVHRDAVILTGPELENCPKESEELLKQFPEATAIEPEGQGEEI